MGTCYSAAYMSSLERQRFTILEVAADWHELMISWHRTETATSAQEWTPPVCHGSRDVIDHVTIRFTIWYFLQLVHRNRASIYSHFQDIPPQHTLTNT